MPANMDGFGTIDITPSALREGHTHSRLTFRVPTVTLRPSRRPIRLSSNVHAMPSSSNPQSDSAAAAPQCRGGETDRKAPTHFLCLPLFESGDAIPNFPPIPSHGIVPECILPPSTYHITLAALTLDDNVERAIQKLTPILAEASDLVRSSNSPLQVSLTGVEVFKSSRGGNEAKVVVARVEPRNEDLFEELVMGVVDGAYQAGLMSHREYRKAGQRRYHVSLVNARYHPENKDYSFQPCQILRSLRGADFGTFKLSRVLLGALGPGNKVQDEAGRWFYRSLGDWKL